LVINTPSGEGELWTHSRSRVWGGRGRGKKKAGPGGASDIFLIDKEKAVDRGGADTRLDFSTESSFNGKDGMPDLLLARAGWGK